ncbi:MAG: EamA family transporter [Ilumatobacter sp.]|uniref:EamA family transporter n=1 Tax=Ilumatobacter sp. TaxID=1967498 RepID=UPI00263886F7|nr:EamA family transporter [Ilumatobacter sp.]MDJ0769690.1 EamA family transporter [Ilumatobacter sp.]
MAALLALLAAVGWGSSDFAAGKASRTSSAVSVVVLTHLTAVIALVCVTVDIGPLWTSLVGFAGGEETRWRWPTIVGEPTLTDLGWGLAAGLGGGVGAMLLFRGLGKGSMAVVAPITAAGAAIIPVLAGVLTGESISQLGLVGIGLALVAIVLVSLTAPDAADDEAGASSPPETATGDDDGLDVLRPADGPEGGSLTVPDDWVEEFGAVTPRVLARTSSAAASVWSLPTRDAGSVWSLPTPDAAALVARGPHPAAVRRAAQTPTAATRIEPAAPPVEPIASGTDDANDLDVTVRSLLFVIVALLVALTVAALGIAAGPVVELLSDEPLTTARAAMMALALATILVTTLAMRATAPLLRAPRPSHVSPAVSPTPAIAEQPRPPIWRRMLAQPGIPEALLSGIGFGTFFVFIYRASESAGHMPLAGARLVSVVMFTIGALATRTAVFPERGSRVGVVLAGLFDAAAAVLFVLATRAGLLSIGAVLASLYPAVTVLLARVVTKERITRTQLAGMALALAAVGLLAS